MKSFNIKKTPLRCVIETESEYFSLIWPYRLQEKLPPVLWRHKFLSVTKKTIIYNDLPRIDFVTSVLNRHPQMQLRVKFETHCTEEQYTSEIQFGVVNRPVNLADAKPRGSWQENPSGVFPSLNWIDYSDDQRGVSLINKGLPSHEIKHGCIYLTLLRSILMLSSDGITGPAVPTPDAQELKDHTFEYSLYPHRGGWQDSRPYRQGYEFNCGLLTFQLHLGPRRSKTFGEGMSFIKVKPDNIILAACKRADDLTGVILRLYETGGVATEAKIVLFKAPVSVKLVNLLEQEETDVAFSENTIAYIFKPFQIVSLKLKYAYQIDSEPTDDVSFG